VTAKAPRHHAHCARYCTNGGGAPGDRCDVVHECWCPDGGLTYAEFSAKHPDWDASAAQEDELP
jgi:hypothetical protein